MSELTVKICGVRSVEHARAAAEAGADLVGFAFAATRRYVSPEVVREIVRELPHSVGKVGLFVNQPAEQIRLIAAECGLDFAQLCGDESVEFCRNLGVPVIRSLRVQGPDIVDQVDQFASVAEWCILDSFQPNAHGGTGTTFDWELARLVGLKFRVVVAGGLNSANVGEAIRVARPWGVDVSSGVETNGVKDVTKIADFVAAARQAGREQAASRPGEGERL